MHKHSLVEYNLFENAKKIVWICAECSFKATEYKGQQGLKVFGRIGAKVR